MKSLWTLVSYETVKNTIMRSLTDISKFLNVIFVCEVLCTCTFCFLAYIHILWQSRIEIKYYSVAYFKRITEFDAL